MKKTALVSRYPLAVMLLIFGLNKFLQFMPMGDLPENAQTYMAGLAATGVLFPLLGIIYLLTSAALFTNRFAALMLVVLAPVSVNAILFHATLAPETIAPALILGLLNILAMLGYQQSYAPILSGKADA